MVLCLGCTSENAAQERLIEAPALFSSSDNVERDPSGAEFDTLWAFGGPSDTLLANPRLLRPDGAQGLVVFDVRNQAACRFGKDGELLWSWGTKGEGPGEVMNVRAMDVGADGSIVLVDSRNRRVVRLSADGRLLGETPVRARSSYVASVAALRGERLAVAEGTFGPLLALWDGEDVTGWATFRAAHARGVFPYVEHSDFPKARQVRQGNTVRMQMTARPVETGRSLSVVGDTLFVLFGGEAATGWVLDKFNLDTGAYLESDVLPHSANLGVVSKDRAFTIETWGAYPRIVALARR